MALQRYESRTKRESTLSLGAGALPRRTRVAPITLNSMTPQSLSPSEKGLVLREACSQLVKLTNGATMNAGGGHVSVVASHEIETAFGWPSAECAAVRS